MRTPFSRKCMKNATYRLFLAPKKPNTLTRKKLLFQLLPFLFSFEKPPQRPPTPRWRSFLPAPEKATRSALQSGKPPSWRTAVTGLFAEKRRRHDFLGLGFWEESNPVMLEKRFLTLSRACCLGLVAVDKASRKRLCLKEWGGGCHWLSQ